MRTSLVLAALITAPPAAFGYAVLPSLPRKIYCDPQPPNGRAMYEGAGALFGGFELPNDQEIRKKNLKTVADEFVQPAMNAACADKTKDGFYFAEEAKRACLEGCEEVSDRWPLDGAGRLKLKDQCKEECRLGATALYTFAYGYLSGAKGK